MPQLEHAQRSSRVADTTTNHHRDTPAAAVSNAATAAALEARGVSRGGEAYRVARGDTLWDIAERTYGDGSHWRQIALANPDDVFRDGELILVGTVLQLPVIQVPVEPDPVEPESPDGGVLSALEPESIHTEYGDFKVYPDTFTDPLPRSTDGIRNVHRAEFSAIIAAAQAKAEAERAEVESEVEDLLSYGVFDWAITDGEATQALNLLGGLPLSQLQTAVHNIPNIDRLLKQLPSSARSGEAYTRLLVALGPAKVTPYLKDLLSYGLFDWCITDNDARAVMTVLSLLPAAERIAMLDRLGASMHLRLVNNLPNRGSALSTDNKVVVKAIFDRAPDSDLDLLTTCVEARFALKVRGNGDIKWDADGLRRSWHVLEDLPPGHVEDNPALLQWIRDGNTSTSHSGWYAGGDSYSAGFNYTTSNLASATQRSMSDEDGDGTKEVTDPLHGVNRFNKVVRHEVGHAVDEAMGAEQLYCIGKKAGGNWSNYGSDVTRAISDMVTASGSAIQALDSSARDAIVKIIAENTTDALKAVQSSADYQALDATVQAAIDADPVFVALTMAVDDPWYRHSGGGTPLNGRIFQQSYRSQWTAYDQAARARKVSQYQFRAPGEWFAEAYAAYYEPKADGSCDHHALAAADSATKQWFDTKVATWAGDQ